MLSDDAKAKNYVLFTSAEKEIIAKACVRFRRRIEEGFNSWNVCKV